MVFCGSLPLFPVRTGYSTTDPNSLPLVHLSSVFLLHEKTNPDGWSKLQNKREKETGAVRKMAANKDNQWLMMTEHYTPELQDKIAETIHKGGYVYFDDNELIHVWNDIMELEERELTLMLAGFTGLTNEELETNGTLYFPIAKDEILSMLSEAFINELQGYGMDESFMFTIGYKDGTVKTYSHGDCDFTPKRPLTNYQYGRTQDRIIRSSLHLREITFIIMSDGYQEPTYFATKNGLLALKKYGDFEEWHNGRGERRRDYIQDDWI